MMPCTRNRKACEERITMKRNERQGGPRVTNDIAVWFLHNWCVKTSNMTVLWLNKVSPTPYARTSNACCPVTMTNALVKHWNTVAEHVMVRFKKIKRGIKKKKKEQTLSPISVWSPCGRMSMSGWREQASMTALYLVGINRKNPNDGVRVQPLMQDIIIESSLTCWLLI